MNDISIVTSDIENDKYFYFPVEMEQNYAIPIRSLHPNNGKRFCKTGMYVIAETSFADAKHAAYVNLSKIKRHLTSDPNDLNTGVCEHL